ncbi:MAG: ATP-dependent RNA helicase [Rhodobacteraceae bacterium]|nr:ATP-dependent RNA helicase [Paracoccaceae bacterium]
MHTPLSEALSERGYTNLTPVQEAVSAPELADQDLLVSAQTGSGKTVGFGLAIAPTLLGEADRFDRAEAPLALVVAPTRELALQVMRELSWLYAKAGVVITSCIGGMDMRQERRALERGVHIVVGTPGRLRDHIERGSLDMAGLRAVVLDEADEMLDLGFREDLEFMLGEAPEDRRTLLFSATVPPMIAKLAEQFQRDAQRISTISGKEQHADISYQAVRVAEADREHAIFNLLRFHHDQSAIVFANTRAAVNHLTARLTNRGLSTVSLSGELSQSERTHALQAMRDGRARVCVATDVAARGIDLPNLTLVIHADLPTNTESLLHRSGRTGRAGRKGISALIVTPKAAKKTERLLRWAKITAEWTVAPSAEAILARDEERLLTDPAWDEPVSDDQAAFAARLLAAQSPERIAAAYLRLYHARHAAPEELMAPDEQPADRKKRERDFGPSRWVALSVGRNDRAEPRWLLPLLCRAGRLDKSSIGAIRVQDSETFVELAEPAVDGFLAVLDEGGTLEEGVTVRALDEAPEFTPQPRRPRDDNRGRFDDRPGKPPHRKPPHRKGPRPETAPAIPGPKPRADAPVDAPKAPRDDAPAPKPRPKPKADKPASKPVKKPSAAYADARDTSKRFVRPTDGKGPGRPAKGPGKGPGKGASAGKGPAKGKPAAAGAKGKGPSKGPQAGKGGYRKPGASRPGGFDAPRRGKR